MNTIVASTTLCLSLLLSHSSAWAASARGTARQLVIPALSITNVSDLNFGSASPGDAARAIEPETSENSRNGSFQITGEPYASYSIFLPARIEMTTGRATARERIEVSQFRSSPNRMGQLDHRGAQMLFVGASRPALRVDQAPGLYTGSYTVTVVY